MFKNMVPECEKAVDYTFKIDCDVERRYAWSSRFVGYMSSVPAVVITVLWVLNNSIEAEKLKQELWQGCLYEWLTGEKSILYPDGTIKTTAEYVVPSLEAIESIYEKNFSKQFHKDLEEVLSE